jgi:hypothetical protein
MATWQNTAGESLGNNHLLMSYGREDLTVKEL